MGGNYANQSSACQYGTEEGAQSKVTGELTVKFHCLIPLLSKLLLKRVIYGLTEPNKIKTARIRTTKMATPENVATVKEILVRGVCKNGTLEARHERSGGRFWNWGCGLFFVHQVAHVP